ncbi:MAG: hypothetical protein LBL18_03405 [Bacteroidales bacterium]|jgi:hypothetical protein|nr:hypothetical protein [Bacteroidales bacterium]
MEQEKKRGRKPKSDPTVPDADNDTVEAIKVSEEIETTDTGNASIEVTENFDKKDPTVPDADSKEQPGEDTKEATQETEPNVWCYCIRGAKRGQNILISRGLYELMKKDGKVILIK